MKFILFVCSDREAPPYDSAGDNINEWLEEVGDRRIIGDMLVKPLLAKTVKVREGNQTVTDGSFEQTNNAILGFDVIECSDLDEAIIIAAKHPMAKFGQIEIRPFAVFN